MVGGKRREPGEARNRRLSNACATVTTVAGVIGAIAAVLALTSGSDAPATAELRPTGEEVASIISKSLQADRAAASQDEQAKRLDDLEDRLEDAQRTVAAPASTAEAEPPEVAPVDAAASELFHAPSGNVSCEVTGVSARCTVVKIGTTFRFHRGGGPATTGGETLPRALGYEASWGRTISTGSVSCRVPREREQAGIRCYDSSTGHGFEASSRPERQKLY